MRWITKKKYLKAADGALQKAICKGKDKEIELAIKEGAVWIFEILYDVDRDLFDEVYSEFTGINMNLGNEHYDLIDDVDRMVVFKELAEKAFK